MQIIRRKFQNKPLLVFHYSLTPEYISRDYLHQTVEEAEKISRMT